MLNIGFVDPNISPYEIVEGLKRNHLKSIAIYRRYLLEDPVLYKRYQTNLFDETVIIEENESIAQTVEKLKSLQLHYLFNGFDESMEYCDTLTNLLWSDKSNSTQTSTARHNKAICQAQLERSGIKIPKFLTIEGTTLSKKQQKELTKSDFPLVIKPTNAAASVGFQICHSLVDLKQKLANEVHAFMGISIHQYLAQELLIGDEYAIDTFSWEGKHYFIHLRKISRSSNDDNNILPRYAEALMPSDELVDPLFNYICRVLDAIGLKYGFCHTEVFVTKKGFFAIDINPRLPGANGASCTLAKETYGYSHVDILAHVLLNKPMLREAHMVQHGRCVYLQNFEERIISAIDVKKLQNLPSYIKCIPNKEAGEKLPRSSTLFDTVAFVILAHKNQQQIIQDYNKIAEFEKNHELF